MEQRAVMTVRHDIMGLKYAAVLARCTVGHLRIPVARNALHALPCLVLRSNTRHTDHIENFTFAYYVPSGLEPASFYGTYPVIRATPKHNVVVISYNILAEAPVGHISNSTTTTIEKLVPGDHIVLRCSGGSCGSVDNDGKYYTGQVVNVES
eukprot:355236-Chlamydomonas_euryale.AAC.3